MYLYWPRYNQCRGAVLVFLIVFLVLEATLYGYPTWRVLSAAPWSPMVKAIVIAGVLLTALATPAYVLTIRASSLSRPVREALAWVAYMLLAVAGVIFGLFVARDAIWLGIWLLRVLIEGFDLVFLPASIHLLNLSLLGVACLLTLYGAIGAHRTPRVRHVEIPIDNLPEALESLRIVQLTDLHVGPTIKRPFVSRVVDATNALKPDLIVFTGDLADGTATALAHDVAPLADLQCRFGPYFVTGNHEYYADPSGWMQALPELGFELLLNEHRSIEWSPPLEQRSSPSSKAARLVIGGLPDLNGEEYEETLPGHRPDPAAVFRDAPDGVRLLLAHQPRAGVAAIEATGAALTLSGHTHGGQLGLWRYLVRLQQPVVSGLARRHGAWIYVSRGVGYWGPPCRLGAPSEITCLRLVRA
jgi:predicted MPP superfamily phosphohydrolase